MAMGVDQACQATLNSCAFSDDNQVILIGTDGIWDVENSMGELFGKERTQELIIQYAKLSAREIINNILEAIEIFRGTQSQNDDITLAVTKTQTIQ
jgi:sigma-B regulation protein RsbU (phosphoserine phosphatase)